MGQGVLTRPGLWVYSMARQLYTVLFSSRSSSRGRRATRAGTTWDRMRRRRRNRCCTVHILKITKAFGFPFAKQLIWDEKFVAVQRIDPGSNLDFIIINVGYDINMDFECLA